MNFIPISKQIVRLAGKPLSIPRGCSKTQAILECLGQSIVARRFPVEGVPVTEGELSSHFGVARGSLREAIRGLRAKGLVDLAPRLGLWGQPEHFWNLLDPDVLRWLLERQPSREMLTELLQIRLAVQPRAAALAATAVQQGGGEAVATVSKRVITGLYESDLTTCSVAFHSGTLRATGNRFFEQMIDLVCTSIRMTNRYLMRTARFEEDEPRMLIAIAQDILDADADKAEHNMRSLLSFELSLVEFAAAERRGQ